MCCETCTRICATPSGVSLVHVGKQCEKSSYLLQTKGGASVRQTELEYCTPRRTTIYCSLFWRLGRTPNGSVDSACYCLLWALLLQVQVRWGSCSSRPPSVSRSGTTTHNRSPDVFRTASNTRLRGEYVLAEDNNNNNVIKYTNQLANCQKRERTG
jgi:hypothetical protein